MVLNYIWVAFFAIAFLFALIALCLGDTTVFQQIVQSTFDASKRDQKFRVLDQKK